MAIISPHQFYVMMSPYQATRHCNHAVSNNKLEANLLPSTLGGGGYKHIFEVISHWHLFLLIQRPPNRCLYWEIRITYGETEGWCPVGPKSQPNLLNVTLLPTHIKLPDCEYWGLIDYV